MHIQEVEALVHLSEVLEGKSQPTLVACHEALLAAAGISRGQLPDTLQSSKCVALLQRLQALPPGADMDAFLEALGAIGLDKLGPAERAAPGGWVPTLNIAVALVLLCAGTFHRKLRFLFDLLDRHRRGLLNLDEVEAGVTPLLAAAHAGRVLLGPTPGLPGGEHATWDSVAASVREIATDKAAVLIAGGAFAAVDADEDGFITEAEFEAMVARVAGDVASVTADMTALSGQLGSAGQPASALRAAVIAMVRKYAGEDAVADLLGEYWQPGSAPQPASPPRRPSGQPSSALYRASMRLQALSPRRQWSGASVSSPLSQRAAADGYTVTQVLPSPRVGADEGRQPQTSLDLRPAVSGSELPQAGASSEPGQPGEAQQRPGAASSPLSEGQQPLRQLSDNAQNEAPAWRTNPAARQGSSSSSPGSPPASWNNTAAAGVSGVLPPQRQGGESPSARITPKQPGSNGLDAGFLERSGSLSALAPIQTHPPSAAKPVPPARLEAAEQAADAAMATMQAEMQDDVEQAAASMNPLLAAGRLARAGAARLFVVSLLRIVLIFSLALADAALVVLLFRRATLPLEAALALALLFNCGLAGGAMLWIGRSLDAEALAALRASSLGDDDDDQEGGGGQGGALSKLGLGGAGLPPYLNNVLQSVAPQLRARVGAADSDSMHGTPSSRSGPGGDGDHSPLSPGSGRPAGPGVRFSTFLRRPSQAARGLRRPSAQAGQDASGNPLMQKAKQVWSLVGKLAGFESGAGLPQARRQYTFNRNSSVPGPRPSAGRHRLARESMQQGGSPLRRASAVSSVSGARPPGQSASKDVVSSAYPGLRDLV